MVGGGTTTEADMEIVRGERPAQEIVGLRETVRMDALPEFFGRAYAVTGAALATRGIEPAGPPIALYTGDVAETVDVMAGFPVPQGAAPSDDVVAALLPGGPTVEAVHVGSYDDLSLAHEEIERWFADQDVTPGAVMWEEYLVGPESGAGPDQWQTRIVVPVG